MEHKDCESVPKKLNICTSPAINSRTSQNSNFINKFPITYFNARSIVNKRDILDVKLKSISSKIVLISETWLNSNYIDSFIVDSSHFCLLRNDRVNGVGGGVAVIYSKDIASKISEVSIDPILIDCFNIVAFDLFYTKYSSCRFILVYLPPNYSKNFDILTKLINVLESLLSKREIYIFGDFNFPNISWTNLSSTSHCSSFHIFIDFLSKHNLTQTISTPTHVKGGILDLVITSVPDRIINFKILEPLTLSCDHNIIEVNINLKLKIKLNNNSKFNFYKGDYD